VQETVPSAVQESVPSAVPSTVPPIDQLRSILPAVVRLVERIDTDQLTDPTPCDEFDVHGVLDHMITGGTAFADGFLGRPIEPSVAPPVYGRVPATEFREAMTALLDAVESPGALDRSIETPFGTMSGEQLASLLALDGLVHSWDLSVATGIPADLDPDVVATVNAFAYQALSEEVRATGAFGPATEPPADATPVESLAAFTGRTVTDAWRSPGSRQSGSRSGSLHLDKSAVPTKIEIPGAHARQLPGFGDTTGYASMAGEYFSLGAGTDIAPLLVGLDHDACHCPHWGYMIDGEVVVTFTDGLESRCTAGEIFFWPPGHSVRVVADTEMVLFSPEAEHVAVLDHMLDRLAAV
jgi:uncharacterized protein (TIGR03086 family)